MFAQFSFFFSAELKLYILVQFAKLLTSGCLCAAADKCVHPKEKGGIIYFLLYLCTNGFRKWMDVQIGV